MLPSVIGGPGGLRRITRTRRHQRQRRLLNAISMARSIARMCRVLDLDPFAAASRAVEAVATLGDDAFQTHDAGLPENDRAVDVLDMLVEPDASIGVGQ